MEGRKRGLSYFFFAEKTHYIMKIETTTKGLK
jgi:hypothetical protein